MNLDTFTHLSKKQGSCSSPQLHYVENFFPQKKEGDETKASSYLHIDHSIDAQISNIRACDKCM